MLLRVLTKFGLAFCATVFLMQTGIAQTALPDEVEADRCFKHKSQTVKASLWIQFSNGYLEGRELGRVIAQSGESWGYEADFDGYYDATSSKIGDGELKVTVASHVEGDTSFNETVLRVEDGVLKSEDLEYFEADCAIVKAQFESTERPLIEPSDAPLAAAGETAELCFMRDRSDLSVTVRLTIGQDSVSGGAFGYFGQASDNRQEFWTAVQGSAEGNVLTLDLYTVIDGQTNASKEVWTVGPGDILTADDWLVAVDCGPVREAYLAAQPAEIPPPTDLDVTALVAQFQDELKTFAGFVAACEPFDQDYRAIPGRNTLNRAVEGAENDLCKIRFEAIDPQGRVTRCRLTQEQRINFASGWIEMAENVRPDGSYKKSYPGDTPDKVRDIMTGEDCQVEAK